MLCSMKSLNHLCHPSLQVLQYLPTPAPMTVAGTQAVLPGDPVRSKNWPAVCCLDNYAVLKYIRDMNNIPGYVTRRSMVEVNHETMISLIKCIALLFMGF